MNAIVRTCVTALAVGCVWGCSGNPINTVETDVPSAPPLQSSTPADPAPDQFTVTFETTKGDFVVDVHRDWSPRGADRFYELVTSGFYDGCRFFRVVPGFIVQFGLNGDPETQAKWRGTNIPDDPSAGKSNRRGTITFAKGGPNSRTTQVFVNYADNGSSLDSQGFTPFGEVVEGMDVVDSINAEYREAPDQGMIQEQGNAYLDENFPNLDFIKKATIVADVPESEGPA